MSFSAPSTRAAITTRASSGSNCRAIAASVPARPRRERGMLVVMDKGATAEQIRAVEERIRSLGLRPHPSPGAERTAIGITGNHGPLDSAEFEILPGVQEAIRVTKP